MIESCIFCKIVAGTINSKKHIENDCLIVIDDINPRAKIHKLIISKKHIPTMVDLENSEAQLCFQMFKAVADVKALFAPTSGFNIVCNNGVDAGQSVNHLHWHFLSGTALKMTS